MYCNVTTIFESETIFQPSGLVRTKIRYSILFKYKVVLNKSSYFLKWLWLPLVFEMDSMYRLKRLTKVAETKKDGMCDGG